MNAPACVVTSANTFTGSLDTSNYMMTYSTDADFTANAWCNPDSLDFKWTYIYEGESVVDYKTMAPYSAALLANGTANQWEKMHESDFSIENTFKVKYHSSDFRSQADTSAESSSSFTHEQTCRPKFQQHPAIFDIDLEDDGTLTVEFSLEFNTTGYANCVNLTATIEVYDDITDTIVYTSNMDTATTDSYQQNVG